MAGVEEAQASVDAALAALDAELERWRTGQGAIGNPQQLTLLRRILVEMADTLRSADLPSRADRRPGIGRIVVDSWPFNSELGKLVIEAEEAYRAA